MRDSRYFLIPWLTLACAHAPVRQEVLQYGPEASIQVGAKEALIVFPADSQTDFPWPAQTLTDRFAGPFWNVVAASPGRSPVAAAAQLRSVDSLILGPYPSLDAVVSETQLYNCELEAHVIHCYKPLSGVVTVDRGRVLIRITDAAWVRQLNEQRPDSAWLRVDRPNRRALLHRRVALRYAS